jgi:DNA-binding NarL/FixJ family response regulator
MKVFQRRILVVEDDPFVGSLISDALTAQGFETVLVDSALAAKRSLAAFDPDAAIVDIELGEGPNGIEFVQFLHKSRPEVASILLTNHPDPTIVGFSDSRIPDGVAYLRKGRVQDTDELVTAINGALQGRSENHRHDRDTKGKLDVLTKAQREVLHMMAQGLSNTEIARRRTISTSAIEQMVAAIFRAFELSAGDSVVPRVEAVRHYIAECGLPRRRD